MYYPTVGDSVLVQFYNGVEKVWYGEQHVCKVVAIDHDHTHGKNHMGAPVFRPYQVTCSDFTTWVSRKEILSKLTENVKC